MKSLDMWQAVRRLRERPPRGGAAAVGAMVLVLATLSSWPNPAAARTPADQHRADFLDHSNEAPLQIVAHLGAWRDAPENSVRSIEGAIDLDLPIVETDVRRTSDGGFVLMHDASVDRTTDGSGDVSDLTLDEVTSLRQRELRGGESSPITDATVPSLREALEVGRDQVLFNIDKAWAYREEIWELAAEMGVEDQLLFKSDAPVAEVDEFREAHPDALYCHILDDDNVDVAHAFSRDPGCFEVVWDAESDAQVQAEFLADVGATSRVWMNTMWRDLAGSFTDEGSLIDADNGWAGVVELGADMIQTDDPAALRFWADGGDPAAYDLPDDSIRIQAEDYRPGGEGVAYHDQDAENRGGDVYRPDEGVDVCDSQGNIHVCWIRAGEWLTYEVTIPDEGDYAIRGRVSSPYAAPSGTFAVELDGWGSGPIEVRNTTGHPYFLDQDIVDEVTLSPGTHVVTLRLDDDAFQNFNLDWIQFDRL